MNDSHEEREVVTMHGVERTGVRFVLSNAADPSRADEYSAWYDTYGASITRPGFLANAFRFENPSAAGHADGPPYAPPSDLQPPQQPVPPPGRPKTKADNNGTPQMSARH